MMRRGRASTSRLRHKLVLQQQTRTEDGMGGYTSSWKNLAELWAEITPISGREYPFAAQLQSELTHRITLRYRAGITTAMRFMFEGRILNIRAVINVDEARDTLEIAAAEGVA